MIRTVSAFLDRLRVHEHEELKKQDITHPPTIGDMYEGLTQDILDRAFSPASSIDITGGFITDGSGILSDELDCMVVTGTGEPVPYTDKKKFLLDDVVAIIQVKKNLYSRDLRSGYANLKSIGKFDPTRDRRGTLLQDAFQGTTHRPLPAREELNGLPWEIQMIYHTLVMELVYPARIILGYDGFASLSSLRRSFVKFLTDQMGAAPVKGYGLPSIPSLICCGQHCLVKSNGMPFCAPLEEDGFWPVLNSTTANPVEMLLQIIWTRLVYDEKIPASVFDDDEFLQPMIRFIDARPAKSGETTGWMYRVADAPDSVVDAPSPSPDEWQPVFLDKTQFVIMNRLCTEGQVDVTDAGLAEFLEDNGYTINSLIDSLNKVGLAARVNDRIVLLTRSCQCVILPDGRFAVAENIAGQLTRWMMDYTEAQKAQQSPSAYPEGRANASSPGHAEP